MLTKSVKSVISVVLKHVARAKKSVQSVRSVSHSIILLSGKTPKHYNVLWIFTKQQYFSFCLHSALIAPNILIIISYRACRQPRFLPTHCLHFLMMLITLYCDGIACNQHRGSEKPVTPTENTLPLCRTSRVAQPLKTSAQTGKKHLATYMVQTVHTTIMMRAACRQQCTQSADLSTRRNTLIFNAIQAKVQSADKITKRRVEA